MTCRFARISNLPAEPGSSARAARWDACTCSAPSSSTIPRQSFFARMSAICAWVNCARLFADQARAKGIQFLCLNPTKTAEYEAATAGLRQSGFDDIVVLAPVPAVIADAGNYLAPNGVMNVFAGWHAAHWRRWT